LSNIIISLTRQLPWFSRKSTDEFLLSQREKRMLFKTPRYDPISFIGGYGSPRLPTVCLFAPPLGKRNPWVVCWQSDELLLIEKSDAGKF